MLYKRNHILNEIVAVTQQVVESGTPKILEIYGSAGSGKTTILGQLQDHYHENLIKSTILKINGVRGIMPFESVSDAVKTQGFTHQVTQPVLKKKPKSRIENLHFTRRLLYNLSGLKTDIAILCVDDSHEMSYEDLEFFMGLFDQNFVNGNFLFIISGRERRTKNPEIKIDPFSMHEVKEWLGLRYSERWVNQNQENILWLHELTDGHPYHIALTIGNLEKLGVWDLDRTPTIQQLKNHPMPEKIEQSVRDSLKLSGFEDIQIKILNSLASFEDGVSITNLSKIINQPNNKLNKLLNPMILNKWITKKNRIVRFFHSIQKQFISTSMQKSERQDILNLILNVLSEKEESRLFILSQLCPLKKVYFDEFLRRIQQLNQQQNYVRMIQLLENLQDQSDHPKILQNLGFAWSRRNNLSKAGEYYSALEKMKSQFNDPNIRYKLAEFNVFIQEYKKARAGFEYCLNHIDKLDKENIGSVRIGLIWICARTMEWDLLTEHLNALKLDKDKNPRSKLDYYKGVKSIPRNYPKKVNKVKMLKEGIEFAESIGEFHSAGQFAHALQVHYMLRENRNQTLKYGKMVVKIGRKSFDKRMEVTAYQINGVLEFIYGNHIDAYRYYIKKYDLKSNIVVKAQDVYLNSFTHLFFQLGQLKFHKLYLGQLESNLDNILPNSRIVFYQNYLFFALFQNKRKLAKQMWKDGLALSEKHNQVLRIKFFQSMEYAVFKKGSPSDWVKIFNGFQNEYNSGNKFNIIPAQYFTAIVLINTDINSANDFQANWVMVKDWENLFYFKVISILMAFKNGKYSTGQTLLQTLENGFNGHFLLHYHFLYSEISKLEKIPTGIAKHSSNMEVMARVILDYSDGKIKKKIKHFPKYSGFGMHRFLYRWCLALMGKAAITEQNIDQFTKDLQTAHDLRTILDIWEVKVQIMDTTVLEKQKNIIFNLLGTPMIAIENAVLTKRGALSPVLTEFICYIFIQLKMKKGRIPFKDLGADLIEKEMTVENICKRINVNLTRVKKVFKKHGIKNIAEQKNGNIFSKYYGDLHFDIELFDKHLNLGLTAVSKGKWHHARVNLELCFHLYRGMLMTDIEGLWLEGIRTHYVNQFIKAVNGLVDVYEGLDENNEIKPLVGEALIKHRDLPELEELAEKYGVPIEP